MPKEYQLLLDDDEYWHMAQRHYDAALWMNIELVVEKAKGLKRSTMRLEELCIKGAVLKNDILRIQKKFKNDLIVCFSATVEGFHRNGFPLMRTTGQAGNDPWPCASPNAFSETMVRTYSHIKIPKHPSWDTVTVTRNDQNLGTLHDLRQCLELWELEMEKWGCNGLGEELGDKLPNTEQRA